MFSTFTSFDPVHPRVSPASSPRITPNLLRFVLLPTCSRGWKPRETFSRDGHRGPPPHVQEHLKTCAAANKERLQGQHAEEVKGSQEKYDRGGNTSYPRTGRDHKWCKKKHRGRHISLKAGDRIGRVRGESHDADTDFKARTHASLDKRAFRRNQGGNHRRPTNNSGRKRGRTTDPTLKHHLVYSKDREVPVNVTVERSRVDEPVNAGPVTTASLSLAESTPSSMADPTPVADSAPAVSSSVVDPMPVTESAAEEPSSLAEPTSVVRPAAEAPSSMAEPTSVVRPAAEAPSTMAESTSSVDELPSPGDEAGPK
ncbi:hypothetical protein THAOC_21043, partial [Thalassiosira oceanica]